LQGTLATPEPNWDWLLTSLKEKLIKIGAKVDGPTDGAFPARNGQCGRLES
jgi:hypothetical protein